VSHEHAARLSKWQQHMVTTRCAQRDRASHEHTARPSKRRQHTVTEASRSESRAHGETKQAATAHGDRASHKHAARPSKRRQHTVINTARAHGDQHSESKATVGPVQRHHNVNRDTCGTSSTFSFYFWVGVGTFELVWNPNSRTGLPSGCRDLSQARSYGSLCIQTVLSIQYVRGFQGFLRLQ
jgi:hypothetical protein